MEEKSKGAAYMKKKARFAAFAVSFAAAAGSALWYLRRRDAEKKVTPVRVACVGDSITFGHGTHPIALHSYPHRLQTLLGQGWKVKNFGVSGSIVQAVGDLPYVSTPEYVDSLAFDPDVLVLMLGTNDSKSHNWTTPDTFRRDYEALIANYLELNPDLQVVLCTCCAVFENDYDIQESRVSISNNLIRTVAEEHGYPLADIHTLTLEHPDWFPDGVHPSNAGAAAIAKAVADVLLAK